MILSLPQDSPFGWTLNNNSSPEMAEKHLAFLALCLLSLPLRASTILYLRGM